MRETTFHFKLSSVRSRAETIFLPGGGGSKF